MKEVMYASDVLEVAWEQDPATGARTLVVQHDPGAAGIPARRRLPEGYGLEFLGGLFGLLLVSTLLPLHRAWSGALSKPAPPVRVVVGQRALTLLRQGRTVAFPVEQVIQLGVGADTRTLSTVFLRHEQGRELLLEGLPPEDARRAVEALEGAVRGARVAAR